MDYLYRAPGSTKLMVTLLVGEGMNLFWEQMAKVSWLRYCRQNAYSLLVFRSPLDTSPRAMSRSLSWQKCLVLSHAEVAGYEQVLWIDADVIINSKAPDISAGIGNALALTDAWKVFSRELHDHIYAMYLEECYRHDRFVIPNATPSRYYEQYGLPPGKDRVWQAGVLLMNPAAHADVFRHVYNTYEEKQVGHYTFNYEMRPLSYHLDALNPIELDTRYNLIFSNMFLLQQPELFYFWFRGGTLTRDQRIGILKSALYHSWFLHLAGGRRFLDFCDNLSFTDIDWNL